MTDVQFMVFVTIACSLVVVANPSASSTLARQPSAAAARATSVT